ncbi:MAG: exonuclease domain-containing protein [Flavobacteriales bacterium]
MSITLNLKKPIIFFDLEATGTNVSTDRIVEICALKINPDQTQEMRTKRINPTIPIPLEASLVHGIYDEDVKDAPTFKAISRALLDFIGNADLAGYNSNKYDVPMLIEEFARAGIDFSMENRRLVDVQNIFHQMEQRTLSAAYKFYCGKDHVGAHGAEADVIATYEVLLAQVEKYKNAEYKDKSGKVSKPVQNDIQALSDFTTNSDWADLAGRIAFDKDGKEIFNFGKHKGKRVEDVFKVEPSYYDWMMNGDFTTSTKRVIEKIKTRGLVEKFNKGS